MTEEPRSRAVLFFFSGMKERILFFIYEYLGATVADILSVGIVCHIRCKIEKRSCLRREAG